MKISLKCMWKFSGIAETAWEEEPGLCSCDRGTHTVGGRVESPKHTHTDVPSAILTKHKHSVRGMDSHLGRCQGCWTPTEEP